MSTFSGANSDQVLWEAPKSRTEIVRGFVDGVPTETSREIPQSILDQTLKDVCGDCNNGWMNDLENRAERTLVPLLRGERAVVTSADAEVLATWAVKTAMVRARVAADPYTVPEDHRRHIMNAKTPPANITVWAATCEPHPQRQNPASPSRVPAVGNSHPGNRRDRRDVGRRRRQ
ncbi:hypothetical protein [Streptomyces sp. NPDC056544]|uniref:hypothetical protein n=1 Tax=unclassified Streptomyces TaxID=2593676 RepID=UPI00367E33F2